MTATIWNHWFTYYVDFRDENGEFLSQEWFNELEDAVEYAKLFNAFIIMDC